MSITTQKLLNRLGHNIWFSSDMHYGHGNIIKYSLRPFITQEGWDLYYALEDAKKAFEATGSKKNEELLTSCRAAWRDYRMPAKNVEEHDEALIANHNDCVQPNDHVYYVGDFAFKDPEKYFNRLNGVKHLIFGNHDKPVKKIADKFVWARDLTRIKIPYHRGKHDIQEIVLCHYAMRVWDKSHHGVWNLCGHSHNNCIEARYNENGGGKLLDVGVDSVAYMLGGDKPSKEHYRPISLEEVDGVMKKKEFKAVDHHR